MKKPAIDASLLLVDDDPNIIQVLSRILSDYSTVRFATTGADALRLAAEALPDLILLDAQMGDMSGLEVCEALKSDVSLAGIPVIFVSSHQESELEVAVLKMGAVDFIRKPFNASQVTARVNTQLKLKRLADDLRKLSRVDGLTGLGNDRGYEEALARELRRAAESHQRVSVVVFDLDYSKSYEALYGIKASQAAIAAVADTVLRGGQRPGDLAARLARDQFALILPDTSAADGMHVAHRVLEAIEALAIDHQGSAVSRHVTCSAGIACSEDMAGANAIANTPSNPAGSPTTADASPHDAPAEHVAPDRLLHRAAMRALAAAKAAGRAQAVLGPVPDAADPGPAGPADPAGPAAA